MADVWCLACGGSDLADMGSFGPVPALCGSLWDSREDAVTTPNADLDLTVCQSCGHVWNVTFDVTLVDYEANYDNALDFSPTFRQFSGSLADRLVERFDLRAKRVAEIGSGKGDFLRQLCGAGGNTGVGYDPTYEGPERDGDIDFVREFFTPETSVGRADFVCCRHVLEHLVDPYRFLLDVRAAVSDEPVPMYFEVPNGEFNFDESGPWDLIYPHVSYFNERSLRDLLLRSGFDVVRLEQCFNGQFLGADVVIAPDRAAKQWERRLTGTNAGTSYLDAVLRQRAAVDGWRRRVEELARNGEVAVWGAGSKGVTFLSLIDPDRNVGAVVDANPRKRGRFLPGPGHQVCSPEDLSSTRVQTVLVMNPAYVSEIRRDLTRMGSAAVVVPV